MTDRELMQQALEALENGGHMTINIAAAALRERLAQQDPWEQFYPDMGKPQLSLAQPEQERLSCGVDYADGVLTVSVVRGHADGSMEVIHCEQVAMPLSTAPEEKNA